MSLLNDRVPENALSVMSCWPTATALGPLTAQQPETFTPAGNLCEHTVTLAESVYIFVSSFNTEPQPKLVTAQQKSSHRRHFLP